MPKLSEEELITLSNNFTYRGLLGRYKVMEKYFDIKEGDTVIDGGSFHGDMAQYFSKKVGKSGIVHAFESHPINVRMLRSFVMNNNLDNVIIHKLALWDKNDTIPFYTSNYSNAGSPIKEFRKVGNNNFMIKANTLDNIIGDSGVDYIWTNIESSEVKALSGMKKILKDNDVRIMISTHKVNDKYSTTNDVINILNGYEYITKYVVDHKGWIYGEKVVYG